MDEFDNNKILTEEDALPVPTAPEEQELETDILPAPEEEEYLPDITEDDIVAELKAVDENGCTPCTILLQLNKAERMDAEALDTEIEPQIADSIEDLPDNDGTVEIFNMDIKRCRTEFYSLDGETYNLVITYDNPLDQNKESVLNALDQYRDMMAKYENAEGPADYPVIRLFFMPLKYPGQGIATFAQPFAYFETIPRGSVDERSVHMLFSAENVAINTFRVTKEESIQMEAYALAQVESELDAEAELDTENE